MESTRPNSLTFVVLFVSVLLAPALQAQTTPTCNGKPATIVATAPGQIVGTPGDDVIIGTSGNDQIFGMAGNDTICGLGGNDQIAGGPGLDELFGQGGNDTFLWAPGDSSDRIEGSTETDTLLFSGANVSENVQFSANGTRLRLTRDIAAIVLDIADVERIEYKARGGTDLVSVNGLAGTAVQKIVVDLEGTVTSTPDGQADSVFVFGSTADDNIAIAGKGNTVSITGAVPLVEVRNPDAGLDTLFVYAIDGNDQITAQNLAAGIVKLIAEGGPGHDTLTGSPGADSLVGGEGDDTFTWTLGTAADAVLGEAGKDVLHVLGSGVQDKVVVAAGALEAYVQNTIDGVFFSTDVEEVTVHVRSGADEITVTTAPASVLQKVTLDLRPSATVSTGDGYPDSISVIGTNGADTINVTGAAGNLMVTGLAPTLVIQGSDYARDTLSIHSGHEADVVNAQELAADAIRLTVRGGSGADTITGSLANDVFTWHPGDGSDIIEGGHGIDTLEVYGSNAGEKIAFNPNGPRLRFTRDVGLVVLDVGAVERVKYAAQGGSDTISFADLGATAVRQIAVDLASFTSPVGDTLPDTIAITALTTNAIATTLGPGTIGITWAGVRFSVTGVEPGLDRLVLAPLLGTPATAISSVAEPSATVQVAGRE